MSAVLKIAFFTPFCKRLHRVRLSGHRHPNASPCLAERSVYGRNPSTDKTPQLARFKRFLDLTATKGYQTRSIPTLPHNLEQITLISASVRLTVELSNQLPPLLSIVLATIIAEAAARSVVKPGAWVQSPLKYRPDIPGHSTGTLRTGKYT